MGEVAVKAARAVNYVGAGTIEFLADADRNFYFLEMNTRIQVEHPVTETGDRHSIWCKTQIEVAAGAPAAVQAERPDADADGRSNAASTPRIRRRASFPRRDESRRCSFPTAPACAFDAGVYEGAEVALFYDPMIAKLATWGRDRMRSDRADAAGAGGIPIAGELTTNLDFHRWIVNHPRFLAGDFDTNFINAGFHPDAARGNARTWTRLAAMLAAALAAQPHQNHVPRR